MKIQLKRDKKINSFCQRVAMLLTCSVSNGKYIANMSFRTINIVLRALSADIETTTISPNYRRQRDFKEGFSDIYFLLEGGRQHPNLLFQSNRGRHSKITLLRAWRLG